MFPCFSSAVLFRPSDVDRLGATLLIIVTFELQLRVTGTEGLSF